MLSLNTLATNAIFQLNVEYSFPLVFFPQFAFNNLLSLYRSFDVKKYLEKQISLVSAFDYDFFGTAIKTMMTAMIKPTDSTSDSDDSVKEIIFNSTFRKNNCCFIFNNLINSNNYFL